MRRRRRPVLVLSLPRSGSSWVGAVLASGRRCHRRHEVITQTLLRGDGDAFRHLPVGAVDPEVEAAAAAAFAPVRGRLVVKEVLPLLGAWLVDRHDPVVVDLERHPAAIAASHLRLGWGPAERERDRLPEGDATETLRACWDELSPVGRKVGYVAAVRAHVDATWGPSAVHVRHEDLVADPEGGFAALAAATGLPRVALDVADEGPAAGPHALTRRPSSYPPAEADAEAREVWMRFAPRSYLADADWHG